MRHFIQHVIGVVYSFCTTGDRESPRVFKPAFSLPPKLLHSLDEKDLKWDDEGSVIHNYKSFGVLSNPNLLGVRSRTPHIVESDSLQVPPPTNQCSWTLVAITKKTT
ncbi:hypothetical protein L6164_010218 [Bauhinia variegata]|uniref:Uncharacterized protein n=1 Tax=Bauhinia variegata TaxID=167791 RepID=A0ACB9PNP2_BAUVA|nr:hypothetical protein L6164_010218 [Bauhinia variegata]